MMDFWGKLKTDPESGRVEAELPLKDHCLDAASVFCELCELPALRRSLEKAAGRELGQAEIQRLALLAFFHDLGKLNLGFQAKKNPNARRTAGHVRETAPLFYQSQLWAELSRNIRFDDWSDWFETQTDGVRLLLASISHHGRPAYDGKIVDSADYPFWADLWRPGPDLNPMAGLTELEAEARAAFPEAFRPGGRPLAATVPLQHRFAGLVMLADWLGSHQYYFPFDHPGDRADWSRRQARSALTAIGLEVSAPRDRLRPPPGFREVFGFEPRPLQALLADSDLPPLLAAESDTGSGKTEAALAHFLALFSAGLVDALYFALPTRVAARELYHRVQACLKKLWGDECPPLLLAVPGYAHVDGRPVDLPPDPDELGTADDRPSRERAWAAERPKRFLAAPVAVGTIDQALLTAIRTSHAHLRRVCLDRALLVIDEVHSSDVYMRGLIRRLLSEHLRVGGRALLLSATLGAAARNMFLEPDSRPAAEPFPQAVAAPYPSLGGAEQGLLALASGGAAPKTVNLDPVPLLEHPERMIPSLLEAIRNKQRVMIVMNTVQRVINLLRAVEETPELAEALFTCRKVRAPHHGRFARTDREILDQAVSERLGKGSPQGPLLLIGTQTLEQSLDIDADWLVTDLCPVDVLLQRIGRLQRHDRGPRPTPVCTLLAPADPDLSRHVNPKGESRGAPAGLGSVYEDLRILQLTLNLVRETPQIIIPRDNRLLVESATHPERLASLTGDKWDRHRNFLEGKTGAMGMAAELALIPLEDFGEFTFGDLETSLKTRLGLMDRRLGLGGDFTGPFGRPLSEISIPGRMAGDLDQETADLVEQTPDGLAIHTARAVFRYTRYGLEKEK